MRCCLTPLSRETYCETFAELTQHVNNARRAQEAAQAPLAHERQTVQALRVELAPLQHQRRRAADA